MIWDSPPGLYLEYPDTKRDALRVLPGTDVDHVLQLPPESWEDLRGTGEASLQLWKAVELHSWSPDSGASVLDCVLAVSRHEDHGFRVTYNPQDGPAYSAVRMAPEGVAEMRDFHGAALRQLIPLALFLDAGAVSKVMGWFRDSYERWPGVPWIETSRLNLDLWTGEYDHAAIVHVVTSHGASSA